MRKIKYIIAITLSASLIACTPIKNTFNDMIAPSEAAQRELYRVIAGYESVQQLAIGFKTVCKNTGLPKNCKAYVEVIRMINNKANNVIQSAKSNTNNLDYTKASVSLIQELTTKVSNNVENANSGTPPIPAESPIVSNQ